MGIKTQQRQLDALALLWKDIGVGIKNITDDHKKKIENQSKKQNQWKQQES